MMNKVIMYLLVIIVLCLVGKEIWDAKKSYKIGYVEVNTLYDGFTFKKELESKLLNVKEMRKHLLDSLELRLRVMAGQLNEGRVKDATEFEASRQDFLTKKKSFEEDNDQMTSSYSSQVMKQLNQYVQQYGKEHGYTYILGADGAGSLMFADEAENVTKEVMDFLNKKYSGVN
jgi:outer membrane protein